MQNFSYLCGLNIFFKTTTKMKKVITLVIGLVCMSTIALARTPQEAAQIASQFISQSHIAPAQRMQRAAAAQNMAKPVELVYTQYQMDATTPAVFVFNNQEAEGFVLVSAEDEARAVLGYSDKGSFNQEDIPENMRFWLQMYADEMRSATEAKAAVNDRGEKAKGKVNRRKGDEAMRREVEAESYPTIAPLLGETVWGQGEPFNNKCPLQNNKRTVTGCVATALSQIMYAHKYPTKGTGSHSYTTETKKLSVSANFGKTTYDWANMIPNYNSSYTTAQANAVATLMYHVGVAANMDYTVDGSGAVSSIALAAITEYFGYDKSIHVLPKDFMTEETALQTVASDLQAGRPIYISGSTVNQEGHAFVCDGMQSNGYLHINWGWNGNGNGYFALSALDPENQGTGGSASDLAFTERVCLYTNIRPDKGGEAMPLVTIDKLTRTSGDAISKSTKVSFSLDAFTSTGIATAAGVVTYFIYNSNNQLVDQVGIGTFELPPGTYYTSAINISQKLPSNLAQGDYELEIRYIDDNDKDHPILVKGLGEVRVPFTVTSSQFVFGKTPEAEKEMRPFTNADFALIEGTKTWSVDLFSSQFWSDTPSETDVLIRCNLHSGSDKAVAGTYTMEAGTIDTDVLYAEGYYQACYQYTPTTLHLTILPAGGEKMTIQYYMEVNGEVKQGSYTTTPDWYTTNGDTYQYNTNYTFDLATTLSASKAVEITSALTHSNLTEMSYFVEGKISLMHSNKEEIILNKSANFYISDDGSRNNQLFCFSTQWLDNTDFTTGEEIKTGDKVIVLSHLQNYNTQPGAKGYIYQHTAGEQPEVDYSIRNLQVTTNQDTVFFNFECEAPYFHVKVTDANGETAANGIIDFTNVYVADLANGTYTLWIRPVDEAQEYYIGDAVEEQFEINTTTTSIEDLETQQTVVLYDLMGRLVDRKQSGENRPFDVPADGIYIQRMGEKTTTIYINKR